MNANEVIATLAGEGVHANDDVNMGQSSNDVFPSAVHLAALDEITNDLLPAMKQLAASLEREGEGVRRHRQVGPHALDGRRARHARPGVRRLRRAGEPGRRARRGRAAAARPDPARRHRDRHRPQHASRVRRARARDPLAGDRPHDLRARRPVRGAGRPRRHRRGLGRAQDGRRLADEGRERHPLPRLRPARRARRDLLCRSCRRAARSCRARSIRSCPRSSRRSPRR